MTAIRHQEGCLWGTYNPSTHDRFETCTKNCARMVRQDEKKDPLTDHAQRTGTNPYTEGGPGHLDTVWRENKQLRLKIAELERKLVVERENTKHYQDEVHALNERSRQMTSAATSAAATTVTALERIQLMEHVVNAAINWATGMRKSWSKTTHDQVLIDQVDMWLAEKAKWS